VCHQPTGRLGRLEIAGEPLASVAPYPPDNAGWLTARAADFVRLADTDYPPADDRAPRPGRRT